MINHLKRYAVGYIFLAGLTVLAIAISTAVTLDNLKYKRVGDYQVKRTSERTIARKKRGILGIGSLQYWIDEGNDGTIDRKFIDGDIYEQDFQRDLEIREEDNKLVSSLVNKLY